MNLHLKAPERLSLTGGDVESHWRSFKQRFLLYLQAVGGHDAAHNDHWKVWKLLKIAGPQAKVVYDTFTFDRPDDRKSIDAVLDKFDFHCSQRGNEAYWRYVFRSRKQGPGEAFDSFLADLRQKAQTCNYPDGAGVRDSMVRDQVVFGVADQDVRETLLKAEGLTLEGAVRICRQEEEEEEAWRRWQQQQSAPTQAEEDQTLQEVNPTKREKAVAKLKRRKLRRCQNKAAQRAANGACDSADGDSLRRCPASNEHELCAECNDYHHPATLCSSPCSKRRRMQGSVDVKEEEEEDADHDESDDRRTAVARDGATTTPRLHDVPPRRLPGWNGRNHQGENVARDDEHRETWYMDTMPDNLCHTTLPAPLTFRRHPKSAY